MGACFALEMLPRSHDPKVTRQVTASKSRQGHLAKQDRAQFP